MLRHPPPGRLGLRARDAVLCPGRTRAGRHGRAGRFI